MCQYFDENILTLEGEKKCNVEGNMIRFLRACLTTMIIFAIVRIRFKFHILVKFGSYYPLNIICILEASDAANSLSKKHDLWGIN